ncbi:hypothetical protein EYF80_051500 [Liparis tanakae]|uniref:Uncharacterized protein n=1 Tax=Liparis tanakae TaxID=230148 RepID=A0A4Z2FC55_9TELE|nr:hypothetical protein EYF80_051500 [Liparis tanakae]
MAGVTEGTGANSSLTHVRLAGPPPSGPPLWSTQKTPRSRNAQHVGALLVGEAVHRPAGGRGKLTLT